MATRRRTRIKSRRQTARALRERRANAEAAAKGLPLPFPNFWDQYDPTKVEPGATPEEIHQRYLEFCKLCPPYRQKRHTL